jgi:TonB family protein
VELNAERTGSGNQWRISWNRGAKAIRGAGKGHVTIQDGPLRKEVELSAGDLQTGSMMYAPLTDDVSLRLEVFDLQRGRAVSEAIRVLGSPFPTEASGASDERTSLLPDLQRLLRGSSSSESMPRETSGQDRTAFSRDIQETTTRGVDRRNRRAFEPPATPGPIMVSRMINDLPVPPPIGSTALTEPQVVSLAPPAVAPQLTSPAKVENPGARVNSLSPQSPPAGKELAEAPAESSRVPAENQTPPPAAEHTAAPASPPLVRTEYHPPEAVSKIVPLFPQALRAVVVKPKTVQVRVSIDDKGKVTKVEPLRQPDIHGMLIEEAVRAARGWRFRPALQGSQPVPSEMVLSFAFTNNSHKNAAQE